MLWDAIAANTITIVNGISNASDPYVGVLKITENPIVREGYADLTVFTVTGIGLGLVFSLAGISIKSCCKSKKRK